MSSAIFRATPATSDSAFPRPGDPEPRRVPGDYGLRETQLFRELAQNLWAVVPERRERTGRPAKLCGEGPALRTSSSLRRASRVETSQPAALSPNVVGRACCIRVRPAMTRSSGARRRAGRKLPRYRPGRSV